MSKIDFYRPFLFPILWCSKLKNWCSKSKSLVQHIENIDAANQDHWCCKPIL